MLAEGSVAEGTEDAPGLLVGDTAERQAGGSAGGSAEVAAVGPKGSAAGVEGGVVPG